MRRRDILSSFPTRCLLTIGLAAGTVLAPVCAGAFATLALSGDAGGQFRLRADYVRNTKDTTNLSASGTWYYFAVMH